MKKYHDKASTATDTNYFSAVIKKIKHIIKTTIAFIVNPLNTNSNEIHIEPFGNDTGSLKMQLINLKNKALWSEKFTELKSMLEKLEIQKCMYIMQQKQTALTLCGTVCPVRTHILKILSC